MDDSPTQRRFVVLGWLTAAAALAYICRNAIGVAESTIRSDLGLTLEQSGWFMGAFYWTYALFQVPTGILSERLGTRITLTIFAAGWSTATLALSSAPGFQLLIVAQLIMGTAQAGIFPASCSSIGHWMPLSWRSLSCGILAAGMQVGAITASVLAGPVLEVIGWRLMFVVFALPGILWALAFRKSFWDQPEDDPRVDGDELKLIQGGVAVNDEPAGDDPHAAAEIGQPDLLTIVCSPVIWWLCGQQICRSAGYMFFASWFPTFLQKTRGITVSESGFLQGLVFAGTLAGCIVGGHLTDRIWTASGNLRLSRSGVGAGFLGLCALLILLAWFVKSVVLAVTLLALGSFFAAMAGPCALATTIDIGGDRVPRVFGLMNMSGNVAAALCPVLVGHLFHWTANWNLVLLLFAAVYGLGAVCWIFVDPSKQLGIRRIPDSASE